MGIGPIRIRIADSVPMLSVAVPLSGALRLPGSAHRRVSEQATGSGQMSMPDQDFRGRRNLKEPAIANSAYPAQEVAPSLFRLVGQITGANLAEHSAGWSGKGESVADDASSSGGSAAAGEQRDRLRPAVWRLRAGV